MRWEEGVEDGYVLEEDVVEFIYILKDLAKIDKDENTIKYLMLARTLESIANVNMDDYSK